ncbi:hypothetical protein [Bacillus sp. AK031]
MKNFQVTFHFASDHTVVNFIEEKTESQVLHKVFGNNSSYFDYKEDNVLYRVALDKVTHVSIKEVD